MDQVHENTQLAARINELGFSQPELARRVNEEIERLTGVPGKLTDRDVRRLLAGRTRWPHIKLRTAIERVLGGPATSLGFTPRSRSSTAEDNSLHRRTFFTATGKAALSIATPSRSRLSQTDVNHLHEQYLELLRHDWKVGGSLQAERRAVRLAQSIEQALTDKTASTRIRQQLYSLASDATSSAAFAAIDAKAKNRSRKHLDHALTLAGLSGNTETQFHVWNFIVMTAQQQNNYTEASAAADAMKALGVTRRDPVYASLAYLRSARALARGNLRTEALRALSAAEKNFSKGTETERAPWIAFYDRSELDGLTASLWSSLGEHRRAEALLHRTLAGIRPGLVRNRALYTAHLALNQARQGELDLACATGIKAYELAPLVSKRTADTLSDVGKVLKKSGSKVPAVTAWTERSQQWS